MARNTAKNTAANTEPEPDALPLDPLAGKIAELREAGEHDIKAKIYDFEGAEPEFLAAMALEDFSLERMAKDFGGGRYRVIFTDSKNAFKGQSTFVVSRRFPRKTTADLAGPPAPAAPVAPQNDTMRDVLLAMVAGQAQITAAMVGRPQPPPAPPNPPLSDAIMLELLKRNASASSRVTELRDILALTKDLNGHEDIDETPDTSTGQLVGLFSKFLNQPQPPQPLPPTPAPPQLSAPAAPSAVHLVASRVSLLFDLADGDTPAAEPLVNRAAQEIKHSAVDLTELLEVLTPYLDSLSESRRTVALALAQRVLTALNLENSTHAKSAS